MSIKVPDFNTIEVSTKTFIIDSNIVIDIDKLFNFLPITEYVTMVSKRGRRGKTVQSDPNKNIADGSIIGLTKGLLYKGISKPKKSKNSAQLKFFRNSVTIIMIIEGKKINSKITKNGKFQMTGCKNDTQAEEYVRYIWEYIKDKPDLYTLKGDKLTAIFIPVMRNIDFSLGFKIDREKVDRYFNNNTNYPSFLDTSLGYTGINIKIPYTKTIDELEIKKISYTNKKWDKPILIKYGEYLKTLPERDQKKAQSKKSFATFLVFQSGEVICSSRCEDFGREPYKIFTTIIANNYKDFEERLS